MNDQIETRIERMDPKQSEALQKLLADLDDGHGHQQDGPFQPRGVNWSKLPEAVAACSKAGIDILALGEGPVLDITKLPTLTLDGVKCVKALKELKTTP